jgi:hypothetical protein
VGENVSHLHLLPQVILALAVVYSCCVGYMYVGRSVGGVCVYGGAGVCVCLLLSDKARSPPLSLCVCPDVTISPLPPITVIL